LLHDLQGISPPNKLTKAPHPAVIDPAFGVEICADLIEIQPRIFFNSRQHNKRVVLGHTNLASRSLDTLNVPVVVKISENVSNCPPRNSAATPWAWYRLCDFIYAPPEVVVHTNDRAAIRHGKRSPTEAYISVIFTSSFSSPVDLSGCT